MKTIAVYFALLFIVVTGHAQSTQWGYDNTHAKVSFTVSHFGIAEIEGRFMKYDGLVIADKPDFSDAKIDFTIDVSSINTDEAQRDMHLRSADFFDVAKYPTITFKSKSLQSIGENKYILMGEFSMHGITKTITLEATYRGTVVDPFKHTKAGFKITGIVDRTQFGLVWNGKLSTGDLLVGNNVNLDINIELIKKS